MQNSLCESPLWDFHHSSCKNVDENRICLSKILASDFRQTETFVVFLSAVAIIGDHIFPRKKQTVALKGTEGRFVLFLVFPLLYSSLFLAWSLHTDPKGKFKKSALRSKVKNPEKNPLELFWKITTLPALASSVPRPWRKLIPPIASQGLRYHQLCSPFFGFLLPAHSIRPIPAVRNERKRRNCTSQENSGWFPVPEWKFLCATTCHLNNSLKKPSQERCFQFQL